MKMVFRSNLKPGVTGEKRLFPVEMQNLTAQDLQRIKAIQDMQLEQFKSQNKPEKKERSQSK